MCGIIGYIGDKSSCEVLTDGLKKMEYRGYDSAGIAIFDGDKVRTVKTKGRIAELEKKVCEEVKFASFCGIGHTRWATHGEPSDVNSHPHSSGAFTVVHNGIIENYAEIKNELVKKGHTFLSQTDTEVVAHLINDLYKGDIYQAIRETLNRIEGSYALGILCSDTPDQVYAARKDSPLLIGIGKGENFIASDMTAILKYTREYYLLEEGEVAIVSRDAIVIKGSTGKVIKKVKQYADWDVESAEKGGYPHFMLKEIYETPAVIKNVISKYVVNGRPVFDNAEQFDSILKNTRRLVFVACGSAYYVATAAKYIIEPLCKTEVAVEMASEFRYREPVLQDTDLLVAISQSGETADTLAAMRLAKKQGVRVLSIVNVLGSSVARESDIMLYTAAGPEIAVATTKAFSAQLAVVYLLALQLALVKGALTIEAQESYIKQFVQLPRMADIILGKTEECLVAADTLKLCENAFFIGRGLDYALALEGSLKLKEISYIHSEAFSAGELKHGPISLITPQTPTVAIATQTKMVEKMHSNICEVRARKGNIWVICRESNKSFFEGVGKLIPLPDFDDIFMPSLTLLPLQIISYHAAVARGCDIDKPRNLAKSVTVE